MPKDLSWVFLKFLLEKDIVKLLKKYPEEKLELQDFYTNRQTDTEGLVKGFADIIKEELTIFSNSFLFTKKS